MRTVLVVDDSLVDRRLVGGLLEKPGGFRVTYAENGREALEQIEREPPDLIVTDMVMPELDGLQLVAALRRRRSRVPVVLMTSQGTEDVAFQALQAGAASYVPKKQIDRDLLPTVNSVIGVAQQRRTEPAPMSNVDQLDQAYVLNNDAALVTPLVASLVDQAASMGLCDEADRTRLGVALEEALVNALYHGNLEVSSELRESDYEAYYELVSQRRNSPPFCDRRIRVQARLDHEQATFVIRDEGPGFNPDAVADPTDSSNLEKVSGRGLFLMRTFLDEVRYNDRGNEVTLVKRRSAGA